MQSNFSLLRRFRWRSSILFGKRKFYMCYCIWFDSHAKITHDCELIINILSTHSQAKICGRSNIVKDDIRWNYITLRQMISNFFFRDMTELFMDAKSSATMLRENSAKYMLWSNFVFNSSPITIVTHMRCPPSVSPPLLPNTCFWWHSYVHLYPWIGLQGGCSKK